MALFSKGFGFSTQKSGISVYGYDFLLRTSRERYIRIFRYPARQNCSHTMTFSADHSQDFLSQLYGIQGRPRGSWKTAPTVKRLAIPQHQIPAPSPRHVLLGIRSIMDSNGVFWFSFSAHLIRFGFDRYAAFTSSSDIWRSSRLILATHDIDATDMVSFGERHVCHLAAMIALFRIRFWQPRKMVYRRSDENYDHKRWSARRGRSLSSFFCALRLRCVDSFVWSTLSSFKVPGGSCPQVRSNMDRTLTEFEWTTLRHGTQSTSIWG